MITFVPKKLSFHAMLLFLTCVTGFSSLFAQRSSGIKGQVVEKATGAPLANVNITLVDTQWGAATDSSGYYRLTPLLPGQYTVQAARIGYAVVKIDNVKVAEGQWRTVDFTLAPQPIELKEVEVSAERLWEKYQTEVSLVGTQRMRSREITSLPGAFDDPTRAILLRSGATGAGDYNSFLTVRGSSPEQNLVVMDGMVIPNPYRFRMAMGGGMSIFDAQTIQDIHLHLGAFTAEYGNALAAVMEVETRTGDLERFRFGGAINLTDASGIIEGPLKNGKISFLLSARRTYLDLLANQLKAKEHSVYPYFYDLTAKWLFNLNPRNKIILSMIVSNEETMLASVFADAVTMTEGASMRHANLIWRCLLGQRAHLETYLSAYQDQTEFRAFAPLDNFLSTDDGNYENLDSQIKRASFKQNLRYEVTQNSWLNGGVEGAWVYSKIFFRSQERNFYFARNDIPRDVRFNKAQEQVAAYLENTTEYGEKFQMRLGLRFDYSSLFNEGDLSHRMSALYKLSQRTTLEAAWGEVYQYPDPLTLSLRDQPLEIGANMDIITAEKATQKILGLKQELTPTLQASLEFYHIDIDRMLVTDDRETFEPFNQGRGLLQGIEFVLEKNPSDASRLSGVLSYSWGSSRYHLVVNKNWIPFNYDRRHALTMWLMERLSKHWQLSLLWRYASGLPYTDVLGIQFAEGPGTSSYWNFIRGERNANRFSAYHRLDARLSYRIGSGDRAFSFYLDLINLYNHKNVYNMTWEKSLAGDGNASSLVAIRRTIYMLPFLPSIGMQFWL